MKLKEDEEKWNARRNTCEKKKKSKRIEIESVVRGIKEDGNTFVPFYENRTRLCNDNFPILFFFLCIYQVLITIDLFNKS